MRGGGGMGYRLPIYGLHVQTMFMYRIFLFF